MGEYAGGRVTMKADKRVSSEADGPLADGWLCKRPDRWPDGVCGRVGRQ